MFDFFKRLKSREFKTGVLPDDRPEEEKKKDYEHREIAETKSVEWKEKPKSEWADYPTFNQNGSGSCVAQSLTKALGVENIHEEGKFVHLSARDLYARRENDSPGMYTIKALKDITENGVTLEQQMPSQGLGESEMNDDSDRKPSDRLLAEVFKPGKKYYIGIEPAPDSLAEVLQEEEPPKPVMITVRFKRGEWDRDVPKIGAGSGDWLYHKITAIDNFLYNGKKAILIDDSWGENTGFDGRRVVLPEWFEKDRIYSCHYFKQLDNTRLLDKEEVEMPNFQFDEDIEYHDDTNDVGKLQEILKLEGFFANNIPITNWYGGLTRKAVKEFQYHYDVAPEEELEAVDGFRVGPKTREKLNELCSK